MRPVLILGAGFLEPSTVLSSSLKGRARITLIDQNDAFVFGFSKLEIVMGRCTIEEVSHPYRQRPGRHGGRRFPLRPVTVASLVGPSAELAAEKAQFAANRRQRWFGE